MADMDKALQTQLDNIEKRTGKTIDDLCKILADSGLEKHGQMVSLLKKDLGMGHGDANTLVHVFRSSGTRSAEEPASSEAVLDGLYTGPKEALRPIHDKLLEAMKPFGPFEEAPKKKYVSYRRKKQFAMIGPATNTRVELGLNMKDVEPTDKLEAEKPGKMCNYKVKLTDADQVDQQVIDWIKIAYDSAG